MRRSVGCGLPGLHASLSLGFGLTLAFGLSRGPGLGGGFILLGGRRSRLLALSLLSQPRLLSGRLCGRLGLASGFGLRLLAAGLVRCPGLLGRLSLLPPGLIREPGLLGLTRLIGGASLGLGLGLRLGLKLGLSLLSAGLIRQPGLICQLRLAGGVSLGLLGASLSGRIDPGWQGLRLRRRRLCVRSPLVRPPRLLRRDIGWRRRNRGGGATGVRFPAPGGVIGGVLVVPRPPVGVLTLLALPRLAFLHHGRLAGLPVGGVGRFVALLLDGGVESLGASQILPRQNRLTI